MNELIFLLSSNGWDPGAVENWSFCLDENEAKEWVKKVNFQNDRWNGCNFDEEIKIDHEKELAKLGICREDGSYNDDHAGDAFYKKINKLKSESTNTNAQGVEKE